MQESAKDKNSVSQISKTCITFCIKIPSKEVQTIPKIYIKQKKRQTFVSLSSFLLSTPAEYLTYSGFQLVTTQCSTYWNWQNKSRDLQVFVYLDDINCLATLSYIRPTISN